MHSVFESSGFLKLVVSNFLRVGALALKPIGGSRVRSPKLLQFLYFKNLASELQETFYGMKKYCRRAENGGYEVSMVEAYPEIL